jgi:hypothetical protein
MSNVRLALFNCAVFSPLKRTEVFSVVDFNPRQGIRQVTNALSITSERN